MKKAAVLLAVLFLASTSAFGHGRGRVHFGVHFGFPLFPYHYYPAYPPAVVYHHYPAPVVSGPPPVYVERDQPADQWWYYCEQTRGYYPYVKECPGGWKRVPPAPPPAQ